MQFVVTPTLATTSFATEQRLRTRVWWWWWWRTRSGATDRARDHREIESLTSKRGPIGSTMRRSRDHQSAMSIFPSLSLSRVISIPTNFSPVEKLRFVIWKIFVKMNRRGKFTISRFVYETNNLINSFFFLSFFLSPVSVSHDKKLVELIETLLLFRERKYSYDSFFFSVHRL